MNSNDFFYVSAGVSLLIIAIFVGYTGYRLSKMLRAAELVIKDIRSTTKDVRWVKNRFKYGVMGLITTLISKLKGGEYKNA
jgi:hypothetical protein